MTRDEALKLIQEKIKNQNPLKHCLAVEAVMRDLAEHFSASRSRTSIVDIVELLITGCG